MKQKNFLKLIIIVLVVILCYVLFLNDDNDTTTNNQIIPTGTLNITENGIYNVSDKAFVNVNVVPEEENVESIIDLTGTTWILNDQLLSDGLTPDYLYNVNLKQGDNDRIGLQYHVNFEMLKLYSDGGSSSGIYLFDENRYNGSPVRTLTIIGGTDATNAELITWLQANATQVE